MMPADEKVLESQFVTEEEQEKLEYVCYAQKFEQTLSALEACLHESDDPEQIILHTLKTACEFYGGDWAGFLGLDQELKLWSPYAWYSNEAIDRTEELLNQYESSELLYRWIAAMEENKAVILPDIGVVELDNAAEYEFYQRLFVKSLIAVPVKPRPTGFLVVRNPTKHMKRSSMLQMLAFVILTIQNEREFLDAAKMTCAPESIKSKTDILVHLFGSLKIYTSQGVLLESDLKSPKISKLLTYMVLHEQDMVSPGEVAEALWPEDSTDQDNTGKNLKALIYRFRRCFNLISDQKLIESVPNGYRLNPRLNIQTDLQQFDQLVLASQSTASQMRKVELLKSAVDIYKGNLLASASGEHWLIHTALHYSLKYIGVVNELLRTLAASKDYAGIHQYATQSLSIEPGNMRAYYWLIYAICRQGATELAKAELREAKENLTEEEYEELTDSLKADLKP